MNDDPNLLPDAHSFQGMLGIPSALEVAQRRAATREIDHLKVVVAHKSVDPALLSEFFPGWMVIHPGQAVMGRRFARVVVLHRPSECEADWFTHDLACRLMRDTTIEWLA